jgi:hypothetical protein
MTGSLFHQAPPPDSQRDPAIDAEVWGVIDSRLIRPSATAEKQRRRRKSAASRGSWQQSANRSDGQQRAA